MSKGKDKKKSDMDIKKLMERIEVLEAENRKLRVNELDQQEVKKKKLEETKEDERLKRMKEREALMAQRSGDSYYRNPKHDLRKRFETAIDTEASCSEEEQMAHPEKTEMPIDEPKKTSPTTESKERVSPLVLESSHQWKDIQAWRKREKVDAKSKVLRDGGLHINPKDGVGYRNNKENIGFHTFNSKKFDMRVVIKGPPLNTERYDVVADLKGLYHKI